MNQSEEARGFVYVATGEKFRQEALVSAESLRKHHPEIPICLITENSFESDLFTHVIIHPDPRFSVIDKTQAILAPYQSIVFLDSDTLVLGDLSEVFDVLNRFDLAATLETLRGWDYSLPDLPMAFPEYTTGLIAFRRSAEVVSFFKEWEKLYHELPEKYPDQAARFRQNQPAFRHALYNSRLRISALPSEYHFVVNYPNYLMWSPRLLHGHADLESIGREALADPGARVFLPDFGFIQGYRGKRKLISTTARFLWRALKLLVTR